MVKILRKSLGWLKGKKQGVVLSSGSGSAAGSGKKRKKRGKSGNVFMQLITLQRKIRSLEVALHNKTDFTLLVQDITQQISLLKREAETAEEEELAGVIGQVSSYFDTVSEGRLALDPSGLAVIRDFVLIFKDAIGDAAPGVSPLDKRQLKAWNSRYQALMAQMEPIFEDTREPEDIDYVEQETVTEEVAQADRYVLTYEEDHDIEEGEAAGPAENLAEQVLDVPIEVGNQKEAFIGFRTTEDPQHPSDEEDIGGWDEHEEMSGSSQIERTAEEDIPFYDPSDDVGARDVIISDAEIDSVREYVKGAEQRPQFIAPEEEVEQAQLEDGGVEDFESVEGEPGEAEVFEPVEAESEGTAVVPEKADRRGEEPFRSPVQQEEIQLLKQKIFELYEKQEKLSSRVTDIIDGLEEGSAESGKQEAASVEELSVEELEDIIFIGRSKG